MIWLANLVAAIKMKMNKAGRSAKLVFQGRNRYQPGQAKGVKQKHRTPEVTNGILLPSQ